jgi:TonB family protein
MAASYLPKPSNTCFHPLSPFLRLSLLLGIVLPSVFGGFYLAISAAEQGPFICTMSAPLPPAPAPFQAEESIDSREIFKVVEQMPLFPGAKCGDIKKYSKRRVCSDIAMLEYTYSHVKYPKEAREEGISGMSVVSFVVEKNGILSNIKVVRDPGAGLGDAAAKVVRQMRAENTRWEPGLQKGKPVRVQFNLPVKFKLVGQPVSFVAQNLIFCPLASQKTTSVATAMQVIFRLASDQNICVFS